MGICALTIASAPAVAQTNFLFGVGVGQLDFELDSNLTLAATGDIPEIKMNHQFLVNSLATTVRAGIRVDSFYIAISTMHNDWFAGFDTDFEEDLIVHGLNNRTSQKSEVKRKDDDISIGWVFSPSTTGFIGYKTGRLQASGQGSAGGLVTSSVNNPGVDAGQVNYDFDDTGFYIGGSYKLKVGPGSIDFSLAYAQLDGELKSFGGREVFNGISPVSGLAETNDLRSYTIEADAQGFSLGLSWNAPITDNLRYNIGTKIQEYSYDINSRVRVGGPTDEIVKASGDVDQNSVQFVAGISYIW